MTSPADIVQGIISLPEVVPLLKAIDEKWKAPIDTYVKGLPPEGSLPSAKSVKDSIWGMVDLSQREVVVMDSPPMQRLRWIRQLGVTYLTFPTADYSRFEHALGVAHQASRMLKAIAARSSEKKAIEDLEPVARLAGMVHDIGHLPFSHLAERYFDEYPDEIFSNALAAVSQQIELQVKLSEFLSFLFLHAPSINKLLISRARYDKGDIEAISLSIIGYAAPEKELLKQLISNIIDADKLDYMFRDAQYTGVPLPVDLDRLLYKLKCLPPGSKTVLGQNAGGLLAVDLGGSHLIEDLLLSRRILSRQVYFHHKTLAAERLVIDILSRKKAKVLDLVISDDSYFSPFSAELADEENQRNINNLRYRNLPRRAMVLSYGLLARHQGGANCAPDVGDADKMTWQKFETEFGKRDTRRSLETKMLAKYSEIALLCDLQKDGVTRFFVDTKPRLGGSTDAELFVEFPDKTISAYKPFPAKAAAFAHSPEEYINIFFEGSPSFSHAAYVAAEAVVFAEFGFSFGRQAADSAKINFAACEELKRKLEAKDPNWFEGARAIRPRGDYSHYSRSLEKLYGKFHKFGIANNVITLESIKRFLDQFPAKLVPKVINMLDGIDYFDDEKIKAEFPKLIQKGQEKDEVFIPITGLGESAAVISYLLKKNGIESTNLTDALKLAPKNITFYEDSLFSGAQVTTRINCWFGKKGVSKDDETAPLSDEQRQVLKSARLRFCFLVMRNEGKSRLRDCLFNVGLADKNVPLLVDERITSLISRADGESSLKLTIGDEKDYNELKEFLAKVGSQLVRSTRQVKDSKKWTDERCSKSTLGFDNVEELVVFKQNTPSSTITALWLTGGTYDGAEWFPLFPRQEDPETRA